MSNGDTIEEFYDPFAGLSITRDETSIVFLWDGPEGISLVVINDKHSRFVPLILSIEFEFDGLSTENGGWVVTDNRGDFADPETDTTVEWNWFLGNRDGGAFRGGLGGEFEITVDTNPAFFSVSDLQFLSGDPADPRRIPLELGKEFTIKSTGCSIEVDIDIKPSEDTDDANPINPNRRGGQIPVAILNDDFNPDRVDFDSLRFGAPDVVSGGGGATPAHSGRLEDTDGDGDLDPISHWEDVDDDGDLDLVVHFPAEDTGFDGDESKGRLEGKTKDGTPLFGTDSVTIVGGNGGGGNDNGGSGGGGNGGGRNRGGSRRNKSRNGNGRNGNGRSR